MNAPSLRCRFLIGIAFALLAVPSFADAVAAKPLWSAAAPAAAFTAERTAVETVIHRFYAAYAAGDLDALLATWEPKAPALAAFREQTAPILRTRCMTLHALTIDPVAIAGEHATARTHVLLSKSSRTMPERFDPHSATLQLVREDGQWRITEWTLQEDELAGRLAAAGNDAEREALLQAEPQLLTPALDRALSRRGVLAANQDHLDVATALLHLLTRVSSTIGDLSGLSLAAGLDSILQRRFPPHDIQRSLAFAYRSVAFAEESGDPDAVVRASLRVGKSLDALLRREEALLQFQRAFALRDELEDDSVISLVAGQIAQYYSLSGDHRASTYYSNMALATARDDFSRFSAEMNLGGEFAMAEGDCGVAIGHLERSIDFARKAGFEGVTGAVWVLAHCYQTIGHDDAALRITTAALENFGPDPDPLGVAPVLMERSHVFIKAGRLAAAEADLVEAVRLARKGGFHGEEATALTELAALRLRQRRYSDANARAREAVALGGGFDPAPLLVLAKAERHIGRRDSAYRILHRLIQATEDDTAAMNTDEQQRERFFASRAEAYLELADMLVDDGRFAEALVVAERCKGRLLLDVLRGGKLLQHAALAAAEREKETSLESRLAALNMQSAALSARGAKNEEEVAQSLLETRRQLEEYRAELCLKYPRLTQHATPAALSLRDTSALLPDSSAAFVEYFVTERRLVIFVVTRRGLHVHTIPISKRDLETETAALVRALAERNLRFRARARRLYDLILAPAAAELKGVKTLAIIPDGPLWQLPFESLVMPDGRFVIERMACFYAPSISVYREMIRSDRPRPSGNFLAFANPLVRGREGTAAAKLRDFEAGPLPDAEREVARIAGFFRNGTRLYVGPEALESRVKSEGSRYDVIHFATHGVLDDNNAMYSHLLLATSPEESSDDGFLETWELMRLDLHAQLAVLSACDTARGTVHAGEGLIGMSWALFVAGCSSTVATQWKVPSAVAADLMIDFYRRWLHADHDTWFAKAEALRRARLHLLRDGKHRDPYYWSGYVLIGSGR